MWSKSLAQSSRSKSHLCDPARHKPSNKAACGPTCWQRSLFGIFVSVYRLFSLYQAILRFSIEVFRALLVRLVWFVLIRESSQLLMSCIDNKVDYAWYRLPAGSAVGLATETPYLIHNECVSV
ncbi:MAG: hypothetical protein MJE77_12835 [Proteobacteria bacterium]|nr:hypothetical protein [Pseudomonadota bacterium]